MDLYALDPFNIVECGTYWNGTVFVKVADISCFANFNYQSANMVVIYHYYRKYWKGCVKFETVLKHTFSYNSIRSCSIVKILTHKDYFQRSSLKVDGWYSPRFTVDTTQRPYHSSTRSLPEDYLHQQDQRKNGHLLRVGIEKGDLFFIFFTRSVRRIALQPGRIANLKYYLSLNWS